jgi:RNA-directed DNA polymerase
VTNARSHRRARHILNIDILDFFGSINYGRVQGTFKAKPFQFSEPLATVLAQLCCHKNGLPLGAPTSPIIANIICYRLDRQMRRFAKSHHCIYTRYADDITISTRRGQFPDAIAMLDSQLSVRLGPTLLSIIDENGFALNPGKTRFFGKNVRQEVTGLVVNDIPNIRRADVRRIRAMLHAWQKYGHALAEEEYYRKHDTKSRLPSKELPAFEDVLRGKLAFLKAVKSDTDRVYQNMVRCFNKLAKKKILVKDLAYKLNHDVWVVEDHEKAVQGTGFFLKGWDFVTCAHCIGHKPYVYNAADPTKQFNGNVQMVDEDLDLAALSIEGLEDKASLIEADFFSEPELQDEILLVGYPAFAPGKSISLKQGRITSFAPKFGVRRFNISATIVAGASGGPVLNKQNNVIGIAVTGADREESSDETDDHGVIPIKLLAHLAEGSGG